MSQLDDYTKVNFGEMELKYGELKQIANKFSERFEQLIKELQNDLGTPDPGTNEVNAWEGEAKNFFLTEQAKWNMAANRMKAELEAAGNALRIANDNYIVAERASANLWNA